MGIVREKFFDLSEFRKKYNADYENNKALREKLDLIEILKDCKKCKLTSSDITILKYVCYTESIEMVVSQSIYGYISDLSVTTARLSLEKMAKSGYVKKLPMRNGQIFSYHVNYKYIVEIL